METGYDPQGIIQRLCAHHKVEPIRLLSALLMALGRYRLFGHETFPEIAPANPHEPPNMNLEIAAMLMKCTPPLDATERVLPSLMDAVLLCVDVDRFNNDGLQREKATDDNPDSHDWMEGILLGERARDQRVLKLVMKECLNQIEMMQLEMALEREKGA